MLDPNKAVEQMQSEFAAGFQAGAASRDAEVVSLTNQRDYEYVRAENAEQERDQLREQVAKAFEAGRVAGVEEAAVIADTRITIRG